MQNNHSQTKNPIFISDSGIMAWGIKLSKKKNFHKKVIDEGGHNISISQNSINI